MTATIKYDPTQYSDKINRLVMLKAEQWKVCPSEALTRLLDELADSNGIKPKNKP